MSEAPLRRSVHFVPAHKVGMLEKARKLKCDVLVLDLEDAVPSSDAEKESARKLLIEWFEGEAVVAKEVVVRINDLGTKWWQRDVEAVCASRSPRRPDGLMVPKVRGRKDLEVIDAFLTKLGAPQWLLPIATELPEAVFNIAEIARGPRVAAITWGCEDLSSELGAMAKRDPRTGKYLPLFESVRSACLLAAKSAGVQAIDGVFTGLLNERGLIEDTIEARQLGFDGKLTIHPKQIQVVHKYLAPSEREYLEAVELLEFVKKSNRPGETIRFRSKMVDRPHFLAAQRLVRKAEAWRQEQGSGSSASGSSGVSGGQSASDMAKGRWFEEFSVNQIIKHAVRRTITEGDNIDFSTRTMNPAALHLDYDEASRSNFNRPLVNSMFTLALVVGLSVLDTTHGTGVAQLGLNDVKFSAPVFYGDTLRVETVVASVRESKSRKNDGIVEFSHKAFNQIDQLVCSCKRIMIIKKRPLAKI